MRMNLCASQRRSTMAMAVVLVIGVLCACVAVPCAAWSVGESLPMEMHLRMPHTSSGVKGDVQDNATDDTGVFSFIFGKSKRDDRAANYFTRNVPPDFTPRFAIDKVARLSAVEINEYVSGLTLSAAQTVRGLTAATAGLAVRFEMERNLNKGTTWIPLVKISKRSAANDADLYRITDPEEFREEWEARGSKQMKDANGNDILIKYLSAVKFNFGYQKDTFGKLTSFRVTAVYSRYQRDALSLSFTWDEHRKHNPHRAMSIVSSLAVIFAIITTYRILGKGVLSSKFRRRQIVMRDRSE